MNPLAPRMQRRDAGWSPRPFYCRSGIRTRDLGVNPNRLLGFYTPTSLSLIISAVSMRSIFRPLERFINGKPHYWARGWGLQLSRMEWAQVEERRRVYLMTLQSPWSLTGRAK